DGGGRGAPVMRAPGGRRTDPASICTAPAPSVTRAGASSCRPRPARSITEPGSTVTAVLISHGSCAPGQRSAATVAQTEAERQRTNSRPRMVVRVTTFTGPSLSSRRHSHRARNRRTVRVSRRVTHRRLVDRTLVSAGGGQRYERPRPLDVAAALNLGPVTSFGSCWPQHDLHLIEREDVGVTRRPVVDLPVAVEHVVDERLVPRRRDGLRP